MYRVVRAIGPASGDFIMRFQEPELLLNAFAGLVVERMGDLEEALAEGRRIALHNPTADVRLAGADALGRFNDEFAGNISEEDGPPRDLGMN